MRQETNLQAHSISLVTVVVTVVTKREMVRLVVIMVSCVQMVNTVVIVLVTKLVEETTRTYFQQQSHPPESLPPLQAQLEQSSGKCLQI